MKILAQWPKMAMRNAHHRQMLRCYTTPLTPPNNSQSSNDDIHQILRQLQTDIHEIRAGQKEQKADVHEIRAGQKEQKATFEFFQKEFSRFQAHTKEDISRLTRQTSGLEQEILKQREEAEGRADEMYKAFKKNEQAAEQAATKVSNNLYATGFYALISIVVVIFVGSKYQQDTGNQEVGS